MSNRFIEFIYEKPKKMRNNVFVLYSPEEIRVQPGEFNKLI